MQGKEASEQVTKAKTTAGIDVSQDALDVHVLPCGSVRRVANTTQGIRELKRFLKRFDLQLIVVEATGKWHRAVRRSLFAENFPVAEVDPYKVRNFARAQGILAKNDRLDARVLAMFAAMMAPAIRPPAPEAMEELSELVQARVSATEEQTALKNQLSAATGLFLCRQLARRIAYSSKAIKMLEAEILKRIQADQGLARRYAILTSIPGIGFVVAATFVACLSELGSCSVGGIAKLAGLAPLDDDSGKRRGVRVIWGGRSQVRRAAYLAAVTAARCNPDLKLVFSRLVARGKSFKLAIIAIARKLVILANLPIQENRPWQPIAPKQA
jgi:transposase